MKSQRLPVSGVYHASASRMMSRGIHRRSPVQGDLTPEPDSADQQSRGGYQQPQPDHQGSEHHRYFRSPVASVPKSGSKPNIDPKNEKENIAASGEGPEDHPFIDFIASIMSSGEASDAKAKMPVTGDENEGDIESHPYRLENQRGRILRNVSETRPAPSVHILAVKRRGMARWLPNIGSFLITGIVILAVVWMTVIELSIILGR